MISIEDCIAMCGLTQEEVLAIAEHEHVPEIVATSIASSLMNCDCGPQCVRDMIRDDIRESIGRGELEHAHKLLHTLRHFLEQHPEARTDPDPGPAHLQ
jgi:hypothetical protein